MPVSPRRVGKILLLVLAPLLVAGGLGFQHFIRASLPQLDGETSLVGLDETVTINRDAHGVPTLVASSRDDLARGLGFLHAQERFFQMDLLRRRAAGELSELVGSAALEQDKRARTHRMRARLKQVWQNETPANRSLVTAYSDGANEGLTQLGQLPFEYLLLGAKPQPWGPVDSLLVIASMAFQLNDSTAQVDTDRGVVYEALPRALAEFLTPLGTAWDAPVTGEAFNGSEIPGPDAMAGVVRNRRVPHEGNHADEPGLRHETIGSNNWAVSGRLTAHGGALLANDMHLGHGVPNIWFRVSMEYQQSGIVGGASKRRLVGVTLPGTPALVAGSNGAIGWGFTNSNGDFSDLILLDVDDPQTPRRYRTPEGFEELVRHEEIIRVKDDDDVRVNVLETRWGPVVGADSRNRWRAVRWTAHRAGAINLNLRLMEEIDDVDRALRLAPRIGIPPQNFVVVDNDGNIGWTIMGWLVDRFGADGRLPVRGADGTQGWRGKLADESYPRIVNPASGIIWTANARVVDGEGLERLGDGGYALGARSRQIRDALLALDQPDEKDMLRIQLDDRAVFLSMWRAWLIQQFGSQDYQPLSDALATLSHVITSDWSGQASADSAGYYLVRRSRQALHRMVLDSLTGPVRDLDEGFRATRLRQTEDVVWKVLNEKPSHLIPASYPNWDDAIASTLETMVAELTANGDDLRSLTWGRRNLSRIQHPLGGAIGPLAAWTDMPQVPLPGDSDMPRVQSSSHGASERLVVSPGREDQGIFHMPVGQAGHPMSPYFGAGHQDWVTGAPSPLLPGATEYSLRLLPSESTAASHN